MVVMPMKMSCSSLWKGKGRPGGSLFIMCTMHHFEGNGGGGKVLSSLEPLHAEEGERKGLSSPKTFFTEGEETGKGEGAGWTAASSPTGKRSGSQNQ